MDIVATAQAVAQSKKLFPRKASHARAMRGLRFSMPSQPPARVTTPTYSLTNAVPAATPYSIPSVASGVLSKLFKFSGGTTTAQGAVFPYNVGVTINPAVPFSPGRIESNADFYTNNPTITPYFSRNQFGTARLLCENDRGEMEEVWRIVPTLRSSTAQSGTSTTITLDSGASAVNGAYTGCWIHINGGTGGGTTDAPIHAQITGYVGSTKVATIDHAWPGASPDATTLFEITNGKATYTTSTQTGYSAYYVPTTFGGEIRMRHYRIETLGFTFYGIYGVSAIYSMRPAALAGGDLCIWAGDSFSAATGTDIFSDSLARITCDQMGWNLRNISIGGTGALNDGTNAGALPTQVTSFPLRQRLLPPVNSWQINCGSGATGSYTLTWSAATTAAINLTDTIPAIQAKLDTTFGAGVWKAGGANGAFLWLIRTDASSTSTAAMTADFTGVTSGLNQITRYLGDLANRVVLDGNGNVIPFKMVIAVGRNDTVGSSATFTKAAMQAEMTALITAVQTAYPMVELYVIGYMGLPATASTAATDCNDAIQAACTAVLRPINGVLPFINPWGEVWQTGTGYRGNLTGVGTSDLNCYSDGTHPTPPGQIVYGVGITENILTIQAA
jgi:hypothetical protein